MLTHRLGLNRWHAVFAIAICALFAVMRPAYAQNLPSHIDRVVDDAGLFDQSTIAQLKQISANHEAQTGNQVVVITVKSLNGESASSLARRIGNTWGLGQRGRDNGVVMLIAPKERQIRIDVGRGLASQLPDQNAQQIISSIITPAFRARQFGPGTVQALQAVTLALGGTAAVPASPPVQHTPAVTPIIQDTPPAKAPSGGGIGWGTIIICIIGFFLLRRFICNQASNSMANNFGPANGMGGFGNNMMGGGGFMGGNGGGFISSLLGAGVGSYVGNRLSSGGGLLGGSSHDSGSSGSSWGGGDSGGGFSPGGGGGFGDSSGFSGGGGGSFDGGGASGSW